MKLKFNLEEIMKEHGVTGTQVAEETGLRPQTVSELRRNIRENIHKEHIATLMNYFGEYDIDKWFTIEQ
ncbi:helix-turn-helix transcriptional regulator [Thalassobacillus sp. CUG 92003]|uniref:helix-turn-helix domain-containing protein n=1 Tax=Thalassobacillus sp. CUG 92003 TaxID=2736641 RepID=UPI0015E6F086|nr:helix-turn-helix transcriptional regulator [Thalassobacillus sp. CUG 92003]